MADPVLKSPDVLRAFAIYDRAETIQNFKVACILGMLLMPAGYVLDKHVYPNSAMYFLNLRLFSSVLIAAFLGVLLTQVGQRL